jgi:hypothetical protein
VPETNDTTGKPTAGGPPPGSQPRLTDEQRRWIGEVAAEINESRDGDGPPPGPAADEISRRARACAAAAAAATAPAATAAPVD